MGNGFKGSSMEKDIYIQVNKVFMAVGKKEIL